MDIRYTLIGPAFNALRANRSEKRLWKKISQLVLERFEKGVRRLGYEARHLNGVVADDSLGNLEWGTSAENYHDTAQSRYDGSDASSTAAPAPILVDDNSDASSAAAPAPILSDDESVPEIPGTTI